MKLVNNELKIRIEIDQYIIFLQIWYQFYDLFCCFHHKDRHGSHTILHPQELSQLNTSRFLLHQIALFSLMLVIQIFQREYLPKIPN